MEKVDPEALIRIAEYLSKPQKFIAVADARAEMKHTLEMAGQGSVVLTAHGEPQVAIIDFATLESMRGAVMRFLIGGMDASFHATQERARAEGRGPATSFDELDSLVDEAVREGRKKQRGRKARR